MNAILKNRFWFSLLILSASILPHSQSLGAVIVFDRVTTVGTPVYLKVLTKGRIFPKGGQLVEFYLNKKTFGKNLTGGDGYGYLKFTPKRPKMITVEASSNGERGSGLVLVMKKDEKAILIEIEGGFKDAYLSEIAAGASRKAVKALMQKYRIIYLSRYTGIQMSKNWLNEERFPESPVLRWRGPKILSALKEKGVNLYAIIGSAGLIAEAADEIEKRFTFDQTEKGQKVTDWDEVIELLK
jgi:hypothetical protein